MTRRFYRLGGFFSSLRPGTGSIRRSANPRVQAGVPVPREESSGFFAGLEYFAHGAKDGAAAERLGHQPNGRVGIGHFRGGVLAVAGHENNRDARMLALKLHGEFLAAHSRHHHIGDEQIDLAAMFSGNGDGFLAVFRFDHLVAAGFQKFAGNFANVLLILGQKHGFRSGGNFRGGLWRAYMHFPLVYTRLVYARKINFERRAFAEFAVDPNETAALLDDAVYGGQSKTCAFSFFLGSKERLADVGPGCFFKAGDGMRWTSRSVQAGYAPSVGA